MSQRKAPKAIPVDIAAVIAFLLYKLQEGSLCVTGQKRLAWWKANATRFTSVRDAIVKGRWIEADLRAWLEYNGNSETFESTEEEVDDIVAAIKTLKSKLAGPAVAKLTTISEYIKTLGDDDPIEVLVKQLTDEQLLGDAAEWLPVTKKASKS